MPTRRGFTGPKSFLLSRLYAGATAGDRDDNGRPATHIRPLINVRKLLDRRHAEAGLPQREINFQRKEIANRVRLDRVATHRVVVDRDQPDRHVVAIILWI